MRSLHNIDLARALFFADGSLIYDNSKQTPTLLLRIAGGSIEENRLDASLAYHRQIAEAVATALGLDTVTVLKTARSLLPQPPISE